MGLCTPLFGVRLHGCTCCAASGHIVRREPRSRVLPLNPTLQPHAVLQQDKTSGSARMARNTRARTHAIPLRSSSNSSSQAIDSSRTSSNPTNSREPRYRCSSSSSIMQASRETPTATALRPCGAAACSHACAAPCRLGMGQSRVRRAPATSQTALWRRCTDRWAATRSLSGNLWAGLLQQAAWGIACAERECRRCESLAWFDVLLRNDVLVKKGVLVAEADVIWHVVRRLPWPGFQGNGSGPTIV